MHLNVGLGNVGTIDMPLPNGTFDPLPAGNQALLKIGEGDQNSLEYRPDLLPAGNPCPIEAAELLATW